jgi:hypothetical protein
LQGFRGTALQRGVALFMVDTVEGGDLESDFGRVETEREAGLDLTH